MICFDNENMKWNISNGCSTYQVSLKDDKPHHICFLPDSMLSRLDTGVIMNREHQPEAEVHINSEKRNRHHGAKWIGCGASSRAVYKEHRIIDELERQVLVIISRDELTGLEIDNHYTIYNNSPAISRHVVLRNTSDKQIKVQHVGSFSLYGIPFFSDNIPGRNVLIHSFPSSWCWEGQMKSLTAEEAGLFYKYNIGCWHVENIGSWSCKEYMPFFIIEEKNEGIFWSVQIEHSGSWRFEVGGPGFNEDCLHIQGGLGNYMYAHWSKNLEPGEEFESARTSLACIQGGMDDALNAMHLHRTRTLIKHSISDRNFPVIFNEWNSTQGKVRQETIEKHIISLKNTGVDVYVIDAGWYVKYDENMNPGEWSYRVGDWLPHPSRFPEGIEKAAEKIKENGMIPGIWTEIEVASEGSKSYNENVQLFMKNENTYVEENVRRFLYFGNPETRKYAFGVFEKLIKAGFEYFKIDYNADCGTGCTNSDDSMGQGLVQHVRGFYIWLEELRRKYPHIIIESCSSGGNRMDYGMLSRTDLASITDQADWFRLSGVFFGVSRIVHPSQMGNWSILKSNMENRELVFTLINSMMCRMHISGNIEELSPAQKQIMIEAVSFYKKWRSILNDVKLYYHTPNASLQYTEGWLVLQMSNPDSSRMLLGSWRLKCNEDTFKINMKEIDEGKNYLMTSFPAGESIILTGKDLIDNCVICLDNVYSAILYGIEKLED